MLKDVILEASQQVLSQRVQSIKESPTLAVTACAAKLKACLLYTSDAADD